MSLAWINLAVEVGIVGTGGLVRLSGSGLGCPRWPECVSGSITPVSHRAQEWHTYIEVGNRMLTSAVSVVAVLLILAIIGHRRASDRRALLPPAFGVLGGIVLQAVVSGISVLTDPNIGFGSRPFGHKSVFSTVDIFETLYTGEASLLERFRVEAGTPSYRDLSASTL